MRATLAHRGRSFEGACTCYVERSDLAAAGVHMKLHSSFALSFATVVVIACDGTAVSGTDAGTTSPKPGERCTTCTGAPQEDLKVCPGGPSQVRSCIARADGTCAWEHGECPPGQVDASAPPFDSGGDAAAVLPAGSVCGGRGLAPCAATLFCRFDLAAMCGAADRTGVCAEKPKDCPDSFDPICGCDGKNYGNACSAEAAGVSVASKGNCPLAEGAPCGTRGSPGTCLAGMFCKRDIAAMCGVADAPGACSNNPSGCTRIFDPVCGCDGMDYANPCEAERASASVKSTGVCP